MAEMPKYAPCGRPERNRDAATSSKFGIRNVSALNTSRAITSATSTRWRGYRETNPAIVGAPTTTPSAYMLIRVPACAIASSGEVA